MYEMITLKPPFRANDMNGLYKRVLKGAYPPISHNYSESLQKIVALMLKVNPRERPDCAEILKHNIVKNKA